MCLLLYDSSGQPTPTPPTSRTLYKKEEEEDKGEVWFPDKANLPTISSAALKFSGEEVEPKKRRS